MKKQLPRSSSIANQFTRHYLIISFLPIVILLILLLTGALIAHTHLSNLITKSTYDLNQDAEQSLRLLGEQIIQAKSRDVARQIEMYFRMHPDMDIRDMRKDPLFMELALQRVGQTGYTAITEARKPGDKPTPGMSLEPVIFRVHDNPKLNDRDMGFLGKTMPAWWTIAKKGLNGVEAYGYYEWCDSNGSCRPKYLYVTPVKMPLNGITMMVSATTYIDEFSQPIVIMRSKADKVAENYQRYIARMMIIFSLISAALLLLTFLGTYFLGRWTGLRYIAPITKLADTAKELGEGNWDIKLPDHVLQRKDEIGTMAQTFVGMSQQLRDAFFSLEQRVTELRQTQEALKASETHYRSLFDGIPVGLYRSTPDGKFLDVNPALARILGYAHRNKLLSMRAQDLYADADERRIWITRMKENGGTQAYEMRLKKCDGTPIWVEDNSRAVYDEAGQVLHYEGSIKDTTEQREANAALQKSEDNFKTLYIESQKAQEVYRSLINSSADAIVLYDMERHVTYASPMFTKIFGWHVEELIGKSIPYVPEAEKESTKASFDKLIETGLPSPGFESRRLTKDGRTIDVSISASRYNDHTGNPAGILVMIHDMTEAKRMKEHLQQVERLEAIATLAGGIAHDFNNLLMVIQGTVSMLIYATHESDPHYRHFVNIEKQVDRGARLTRQLLGYARKGKYDVKILNLNDILREGAETLRQTRKDIRVHYHLAENLHNVEADTYQMEQVFMNLFINAADAMNSGGDLTLTTKNISVADIPEKLRNARTGSYILFTVEDTGIGMDKKTMDRIFEPFFTTKEVNKGTGLGLASVYGIIKSHGGTIDVDSEPGKGSKFFIYLPATSKERFKESTKPRKALQGKGTLLLIDDEKPVLDIASAMLESIGYSTLKAASGLQGLEFYEREKDRIDLVILDMIMPDMNGGDVFDRLREINPQVMVLLASGYSIDGRAMDILNRGCNGFIQKPFGMEDLTDKISSILKE